MIGNRERGAPPFDADLAKNQPRCTRSPDPPGYSHSSAWVGVGYLSTGETVAITIIPLRGKPVIFFAIPNHLIYIYISKPTRYA